MRRSSGELSALTCSGSRQESQSMLMVDGLLSQRVLCTVMAGVLPEITLVVPKVETLPSTAIIGT